MATIAGLLAYINPFKGNYPVSLDYGEQIPAQFGGGIQHAIDFKVPAGTPIYAANSGKIIAMENNYGGGNLLKILHPDGLITVYAHLKGFTVHPGDTVTRGQIVGYSGNTGHYTTGPHLLFGVETAGGENLNPHTLFDATKPGSASDYKNYVCRPIIPFVGMNKDLWKPANADGGCDIGWIQVDPKNTFIDLSGTPLEGAADTVDNTAKLVGKLFDPQVWAHALAIVAGAVLVYTGWNAMWRAT